MSWDDLKKFNENAKQSLDDKTYEIEVICRNCGFHGHERIKRGTVVEQKACRACGCASLDRYRRAKL